MLKSLRSISLGSLNERDRRALRLGVLVLAPALLYVFAFKPYRARLVETRDQVQAERALLDRELALVARGPSLPTELKRAEMSVVLAEGRLVRAANVPMAEAELTEELEDMASSSRVLLQEIRGVALGRGEEPPPGMRAIRLALRGESDLEGTATFLHRIETSKLVLRLREVSLEAKPDEAPRRTTTRGRPAPPPQVGVMQFAIVVEGYVPALAEEQEEEKR